MPRVTSSLMKQRDRYLVHPVWMKQLPVPLFHERSTRLFFPLRWSGEGVGGYSLKVLRFQTICCPLRQRKRTGNTRKCISLEYGNAKKIKKPLTIWSL